MLVEESRCVAIMSYFSLVIYLLLMFIFLRYSIPYEDDDISYNTVRLLLGTSSLLCFGYLILTCASSYRLWIRLRTSKGL